METGTIFSVEPKRPIRSNNYVCDKTFQLDELDKLQEDDVKEHACGVALVNGRTSEFYLVSDLQVKLLGIVTTTTMNHHRRGGSSSARIARLRENKIDHNVAYICEEIESRFADIPLFIGGCAEIRHLVVEELDKQIQVVECFAWQGTGIASAREVFEAKRDVFFQWMRKKEDSMLEPLWKVMNTTPDLLLYGKEIDEQICQIVYVDDRQYPQFSKEKCRVILIAFSDALDAFGGRIGITIKVD